MSPDQRHPWYPAARSNRVRTVFAGLQRVARGVAIVLAAGGLTVAAGAVEKLKVRIGAEVNSPPLSFVTDQGKPSGFGPELLEAVAAVAEIEFEIVNLPWNHLMQEFEEGRLDALVNAAIVPDRRSLMDFSIPHSQLHAIAFTRPGMAPPRRTRDFAGKRIAVVAGSLSEIDARLNNGWGGQLVTFPTKPASLDAVRNGECNFALHLRPAPENEASGLQMSFVDDLVQPFRIAVRRGDVRTLERINDGLAKIIADGTRDRIYTKWIGPIEPRPLPFAALEPYLWPMLLVALALSGLLVWQQKVIGERRAREQEISRLNRVHATISRVNYAMVHLRERDALLKEISRIVVEVGGFKIAWIGWLDPATSRLVPQAVAGDVHGYVESIEISSDPKHTSSRGPTATTFRSGRTYVCNDFFTDPATTQWRDRARKSGFKSSICMPLREDGRVQGVLSVYAEEADFFGPPEVELLEETAADLSFALTALRIEEQRHHSESMLEGIFNSIPQAVFWKDRQSVYLGANAVFARFAGLEKPADIIGKTDFDLPWGPEQSERFRADDEQVMASGRPRLHIVEELHPATGGARWLDTSKIPLLDRDGKVYGILGVSSDITERKRMEDALRESRALTLAVMNSTDDLIWAVDAKHFRLTSYNRAFAKFLREWRGLEAVVGLATDEALPGDALTRWQGYYQHALKHGTFSTELTPAGTNRVFWLVLNLMKHGDEVIGISMFARDVTVQQQTDSRLRESEHRFSSLVRNLHAGVVTHDETAAITFCNQRALDLLGLTQEQLLGKTPLDPYWQIIHDDGSPFPGGDHPPSVAVATRQPVRDVVMGVHNPKRRETVWLLVSSEPLPGEPLQVITVFHDITSLRASEARSRLQATALEAAANMVMITDVHGKIQWVNPAFERTTGYAAHEAIGRTPRILRSGQQSTEFYAEMWRTILSGRSWTGEMVNSRKDGGLFTQVATITPVRDKTGVITHFVDVMQDITQQKLLEKQLIQTQRLESIGLLASGIAHDLNNILAPISLSIELMRHKYPLEQRGLDLIEQCARRGADIVRQVLTFARGVDGARTPLKLSRLLKETARLMGETLPRSISLTYDVDAAEDTVSVDPTQMHQVLLNLAVNARDAMPSGGQLGFHLTNETLAPGDPRLTASARPGPYVVLTVADTGQGIPPEILPNIFDPFFTTKPRGQGTGLGLSTVHGIVRSHHGFIQVESTPGVGTKFHIYLPAEMRAQEKSTPPMPATSATLGQGELILVADDELAIRETSRLVLERAGYTVVTAEDGRQAVANFQEHETKIKLVILDRMMPEMDGLNAARIIHQFAPAVPIFLSTGLLNNDDLAEREAQMKRSGIMRVLRKPYTEPVLLEAVQRALAPRT